mmetsp:Transcript_14097/g.20828  ORF Transcript_14097/g.20828 Transcript_14097/m.20828 type:complete len:153 (-) Transcript_14097:358-816(-)|eukprot:CAMPEP_0194199234 /NCGR_PEP_ID=MMETSP0156-20130528/325_1 /TAXON_ID=33649 /ORGANISM="Thalassionema nitzschioides, Strain L26-B" /LENGTH=152 /DNA_ID=CAMNT_0038924099 /DNA_START=255 /DNA_END=713 /DNA_ORIENTATION=-
MSQSSTLTEEQKELIRKNREKALEIQKRKRKEREEKELSDVTGGQEKIAKRRKEEEDVELEEFEIGAPLLVTKKEAKERYCLPEGTLAVCSFVEKENPHRKGWNKMKLYERFEIRLRARKRYGGLEGLIEERDERARKKFEKDLDKTKHIFK